MLARTFMFRIVKRLLWFALLLMHQLTLAASALILHDTDASTLPSLFLANLLGHFNHQTYTILPMHAFDEKQASEYETIFYLGTHYNARLPQNFLKFTLTTTQTVVWFKYNVWQLETFNPDLFKHYGFHFLHLDHRGLNRIRYKNILLHKNQLDKELGVTVITDPEKVEILATAEQIQAQIQIPYIIHSDNFWYVGDIPFTHIDEDDRYLAFADILYDILKIKTRPKKRALIRLEDIRPHDNTQGLAEITDYLHRAQIPFAISLIPYYKDPLHIYPMLSSDFPLTDAPQFVATIKDMQKKGGTLILHGYTHQIDAIPNPYLGISGADFEFMRVIIEPQTFDIISMTPLPQDSKAWVSERIQLAENLLAQAGLSTSYWETPHYTASAVDHAFFAEHFEASSGRIEYYDELLEHGNQFFPYPIYQDVYGQKIIPENLGCYSPSPWYNHPKRDLVDLLTTAKNNLVLRDAWASFYYHPYMGLAPLKTFIEELQALGYEFVSVETALRASA